MPDGLERCLRKSPVGATRRDLTISTTTIKGSVSIIDAATIDSSVGGATTRIQASSQLFEYGQRWPSRPTAVRISDVVRFCTHCRSGLEIEWLVVRDGMNQKAVDALKLHRLDF